MLRPPFGFLRRLRQLCDEPTLVVEFDEHDSEKEGRQVWHVLYSTAGEPTWLCDWQGPLDGNLDAVAYRVQRYDCRRVDAKTYHREMRQKLQEKRIRRRDRRLATWMDIGSHMRRAFQRLADAI